MRPICFVAAGLAFAATATATALAQAPSPAEPESAIPIEVAWDRKIAMRDGVRSSATIYRDPKQGKRVPAIVMLSVHRGARARVAKVTIMGSRAAARSVSTPRGAKT